MYLPLEYVKRYSVLTELYCSEEYINCEPEVLLEMIADADWGTSNYSGPNKEGYIHTYNMFDNNYFAMHTISACFATAGFAGVWKYNKIVYEPDYDFSQALIGTNKLRVYPEMLKHIPFNTFYLDFSKNELFVYEGFFVQVKVYDTGVIRISSLPTEIGYSHIPVHEYEGENPTAYADAFWIKPEMYSVDNGVYYFDYNLYKDLMYTSDSFRTQWFIGGVSNFRLFLLQFLMYLSSKEADIIESPETIKTYKPSSLVKNKYSEVRKWNVGCRYGEKIRSYQKNKMQQYENSESSQNGKRPHIRKAHWERYHVGEGRKDIITKWKEPVFVNGDFNDIVANIHVVTNKEAYCSLGEGLVKQYLEAKKISFRTEHYIREIRKRYDFSLEWNKTLLFIEFDGEQHFKSINRWGGKKGYLKRRQADIEKNEYCRNKGIPLLRIRFDQAYLIPNMIDDFLKNSEKYSQQFNTYLADDVYYSICQ